MGQELFPTGVSVAQNLFSEVKVQRRRAVVILYLFQRLLLKKKKELERICLKMRVDLAISIRGPMGGTCLGRGPLPSEEAGVAVLLGTKTHIFIDSFIETSEPGKFQAPRLSHSLAAPPSLGCGFHGNSLSQLLSKG